MIPTEELIAQLAAQAGPVRRAWPPAARAGAWLATAVAIVAVLALLHGTRADLPTRLGEAQYCLGIAAAFATGGLGALAACLLSLPDRSRWWLLLPLPTALLWLSTITYGCLAHWVAMDAVVVVPGEGARCLTTLAISSLPLSAGLFWVLRRSARLRPWGALAAASVAVGAMTAAALNVLHAYDASIFVLVWNFGAAGVVALVDAALGRALLRPAGQPDALTV